MIAYLSFCYGWIFKFITRYEKDPWSHCSSLQLSQYHPIDLWLLRFLWFLFCSLYLSNPIRILCFFFKFYINHAKSHLHIAVVRQFFHDILITEFDYEMNDMSK